MKGIAYRIAGMVLVVASAGGAGRAEAQQRQMLHAGWRLQSSSKAGVDGARISSRTYKPTGWYRASVPSTVVGALVDAKIYRDPFFGINLRKLPGMGDIREQMDKLATLCEERRVLAEQERIHFWLHSWLILHVPLSVALLVLGVAHVVTALYY